MLLYTAITQLLIGVAVSELGNVEHGLVYHLSKCIVPHKHIRVNKTLEIAGNNIFGVFQQVSFCWKTTLHGCNDHRKKEYLHTQPLCGFLHTGMQLFHIIGYLKFIHNLVFT